MIEPQLEPTSHPPLHTQAPLERFSNRAQDYARYRPSYPAAAIDTILDKLGNPAQLIVADVGAGTGISSRLIADRGAQVWAIEPNAAMRQTAPAHPRVQFQDNTAEQTDLPSQSVDLVLCCQSFHWFNQPVALAEFHRILKPTGQVALMWNDRNLDDPFTQAYSNLVCQFADRQIYDRNDRKSATALETSPHFTHFRTHQLFHTHPLDLAGLIGLALSSSYIPKTGTAYEQLKSDLETLYHHWTDHPSAHPTPPPVSQTVSLSYRVNLYLADRSSNA